MLSHLARDFITNGQWTEVTLHHSQIIGQKENIELHICNLLLFRCNKLDSIQDCSSSTVRHEAKRSSSQEFEGHGGYYAKQYADSKHESLMTAHQESLKEGRRSMSQAVRRAEQHASASGRDPRHVLLPRDKSDDICKKVQRKLFLFSIKMKIKLNYFERWLICG